MNPRRVAVEDRVLALADELQPHDEFLAARLIESVPDSYGNCDQHVAHMCSVIEDVAERYPASFGAKARRLLATLDDIPSAIGRRGRVWVGEDSPPTGSVLCLLGR